eukprot:Protomagalhaensia_wolfi_Nauph_80__3331@NODE_3390_length_810_cov_4_106355_g2658_i0_p3_GENE_NODE_3390_length_810_cov_4_106355_g2658_i0NODE_3390_length_810_cov_4_106355_g2658_i0_p3_ORF_typecomplete_len100_score7_96DUF1581/PF07619_11/0_16_NODE_3390_length_810_cov_4_106355_g2658_i0200499
MPGWGLRGVVYGWWHGKERCELIKQRSSATDDVTLQKEVVDLYGDCVVPSEGGMAGGDELQGWSGYGGSGGGCVGGEVARRIVGFVDRCSEWGHEAWLC